LTRKQEKIECLQSGDLTCQLLYEKLLMKLLYEPQL
jgi:hypothetical protein